MGYGGMQGIPMVASSPVRHESPLNLHGLEVTSYQPPWKALSDFALHADLDNNGSINHTPAFQHLVNQVLATFFLLPFLAIILPSLSSCFVWCLCPCCAFLWAKILFFYYLFPSFWLFFSCCLLCSFAARCLTKSVKLFWQIKKDGNRDGSMAFLWIIFWRCWFFVVLFSFLY